MEKTANQPVPEDLPAARSGKLDLLLGRLDLIAILTTVGAACLLGLALAAMVFIELVKLVSRLWSDSFDRWLMIVFALAIVWAVMRAKKMCVW